MSLVVLTLLNGFIGLVMMPVPEPLASPSDVRQTIRSIMLEQQAAWNQGNYESFFAFYTDDATYVSGDRIIRGRAAILRRFRRRYGTKETMGKLTFSDLFVLDTCRTDSGYHSVWIGGKWQLRMDDGSLRSGRFTLGWRWDGKRWQIFYDHSS